MAFRRIFYTPYWTTFELRSIEMKAASVGLLDQIVIGLRQWRLRRGRAAHFPLCELPPKV
jgi:hypothetical protein